ncbi:MAG TPA: LPXTG cell wall anchor domain-containing protein [Candidatus Acidoferrales bacterium]|nr:LPXTG cell wall anchor domain-containing protein [Candidatus Acidoferrales bacterium]
METVTLVRIIAGILAVVVLGVIIWRRRRQASED